MTPVTKRIDQLTAAQKAQMPVIRDKWLRIGLSTTPGDHAKAEQAIALAYKAAKLTPPSVYLWLSSPLHGAVAATMFATHPKVRAQVWAQVWAQVGAQVGDQVEAQVGAQVWVQVGDQVWAQVWAQVRDQVWAQVRAQVWAQVGDQVRAQVRDQVWAQVNQAGYGLHDANWLGFYEFFHDACGLTSVEPLLPLMALAYEAGWWWPFASVCIMTEKPTALHRDAEHRLHNVSGPAIDYGGTWGVWAWHGVRVPESVIKGNYTAQDCLKEKNAEVKRVMIERMGRDAFFAAAGGQVLHRDTDGQGNQRELVRVPMPEAEAGHLLAVHVICPSTDRHYYLSVPPTVNTCQAAVAATFGLTEAQYRPEIES